MGWLFLFTIAVCIAPYFKPDLLTANPNQQLTIKTWVMSWLSLYVIIFVLVNTLSSDDKKQLPEGTIEQRIKFLVRDVEAVSDFGEVLQITHLNKTTYGGEGWVFNFAKDAEAIIKRLNEITQGKEFKTVAFIVKVPTTDNLGHEGAETGMKVFYDMAVLKSANFDSMTAFNYLEVPEEIVFKRFGRDNTVEYCKTHAEYNKIFCGRALLKR